MNEAGTPTLAARRVAGATWALAVVLGVPTVVFVVLGASEHTPADGFGLTGFGGLAFLLAGVAFATVGALITSRVAGNAIGWIFCLVGFLMVVGNLAYQYADYALYVSPDSLPGGSAAAVIQNLTLTPCFGLLGVSLLLFPNGRLPSPRWHPALLAALTGCVLIALGYALRPGVLDKPFERVVNPFGTGTVGLFNATINAGWFLMAASVGLAAVATVLRFRRSRGQEHQQMKWIGLAAAVAGVVFVANGLSFAADVQGIDQLRLVIVGLAFAGFPLAAGAAILRYRLYDIDVVINRALVYAGLTASLAGVYLATVLLAQLALSVITQDSGVAVAISTLAVAGLARPARSQIQSAVDRRFYRSKYDATRTLEAFSARLRDEVELAALSAELGGAVRETLQPAHVSLWLAPRRASDGTGVRNASRTAEA